MKSLPFTKAVWEAKLPVLQGPREAQTRRMEVGLRDINEAPDRYTYLGPNTLGEYCFEFDLRDGTTTIKYVKPRHRVGEIACVPEAWCIGSYERWRYVEVVFKAGGAIRVDWNSWMEDNTSYARSNVIEEKWRSPRFMPAWAARWFVLFTAPPVPQRVQEITEAEAKAEGIMFLCADDFHPDGWAFVLEAADVHPTAIDGYAAWWDAAYPKYPFSSNPWEITYRFHLTERPEGL